MTLPSGPRMPAPAQVLTWGARPTAFLESCLRRYGDAFTLRLIGFGERGFSDVVFLTDPGAIKTLFTAGPEKLLVGDAFQATFVQAFYDAVVRFRDAQPGGTR